jgi:hypothetical protein
MEHGNRLRIRGGSENRACGGPGATGATWGPVEAEAAPEDLVRWGGDDDRSGRPVLLVPQVVHQIDSDAAPGQLPTSIRARDPTQGQAIPRLRHRSRRSSPRRSP